MAWIRGVEVLYNLLHWIRLVDVAGWIYGLGSSVYYVGKMEGEQFWGYPFSEY